MLSDIIQYMPVFCYVTADVAVAAACDIGCLLLLFPPTYTFISLRFSLSVLNLVFSPCLIAFASTFDRRDGEKAKQQIEKAR